MNFVAVAIVSVLFLAIHSTKELFFIGLNCILLCLNNSIQIAKRLHRVNNELGMEMLKFGKQINRETFLNKLSFVTVANTFKIRLFVMSSTSAQHISSEKESCSNVKLALINVRNYNLPFKK